MFPNPFRLSADLSSPELVLGVFSSHPWWQDSRDFDPAGSHFTGAFITEGMLRDVEDVSTGAEETRHSTHITLSRVAKFVACHC